MRIIVGLSGGVDSAMAAYLLKAEGHEVIGVFMKNWEDDDTDEYCTSREDFVSAAACAEVIGIDLQYINFAKEYRDRVFASFLSELRAGRTPNPDILCNSEVKFAAFLDMANTFNADAIATGHYADKRTKELKKSDNADTYVAHYLYACADERKDQTYFLHHLLPQQLEKTLFPLANYRKTEIRMLAKKNGIPSAERPDSTGICFIGERPFREFLAKYLPKTEGDIINADGKVLGKHQGLAFYTLGQRKGINVGGVKGADEGAWFVAKKDVIHNTLMIVQNHQNPILYQQQVTATNNHWIAGSKDNSNIHVADRLFAKVRHQQTAHHCQLTQCDDSSFTVKFNNPQWAVTPGQSLVLYRQESDGLACLGGGVIEKAC